MAARNLLTIKKLPVFKAWLDANSVENRTTNAAFQVLQVRVTGDPRWHSIYKKLDAKEHLSVPQPLVFLVDQFLRREKIEQPAPAPELVTKEVGSTPPWE